MKLNVVTLCSGYDAMSLALKRLRRDYPSFDFDLVAWSEIDRYAIAAHNALHPEFAGRNLGDMTRADFCRIVEPIDLLVYSTPCQTVSSAGSQAGMTKGDDAASALIWYTEHAVKALRPRFLLLENVKNMVSKKFMPDFMEWCGTLASYGYTNFWQVLNAADYGVPQGRERVFLVSIYDPDGTACYEFPNPVPLKLRMHDVLEAEPPESLYFTEEAITKLLTTINRGSKQNNKKPTDFDPRRLPWRPQAFMLAKRRTAEGNRLRSIGQDTWGCKELKPREDGLAATLVTAPKENLILEPCAADGERRWCIRLLSPREAFRLMDVEDADIDLIQSAQPPISPTQQYKLAGNSICVSPLYHIFKSLFITERDERAMTTPIYVELF